MEVEGKEVAGEARTAVWQVGVDATVGCRVESAVVLTAAPVMAVASVAVDSSSLVGKAAQRAKPVAAGVVLGVKVMVAGEEMVVVGRVAMEGRRGEGEE